NGAGVPADQREKIFSLFESNKGASGTGLGLPVSAKIMREHGGQIEVSDSGVGSGSRFRLRLPADSTRASEIERRDTMG
ncbi:MAG: HAMP domain-containing sensor histidine kinase, partial [Planctomycetota bacterium]